jgi:hypothetical protein
MPEFPTLPPIALRPISVILLAAGEQPMIEEVVARWVTAMHELTLPVTVNVTDPVMVTVTVTSTETVTVTVTVMVTVTVRPMEILLMDDGPEDRCAALQISLSPDSDSIRVLRDPRRRGSGAALRLGIESARHPLLFYSTCDRQFSPRDIALLLAEIDKVELVTACRTVPPVPLVWRALGLFYRVIVRVIFGVPLDRMPGWLGWGGLAYRWLVRICFGVRVSNVDCPFRLFRRQIFARIPIQSNGDFAHVEILAKANHLGHVMAEVSVVNQPLPAVARDVSKALAKQRWREGYRVFAHPDFGPALLPSPGTTVPGLEVGGESPSPAVSE